MSQSYEEEISLLQAETEDYKTQLRIVTEEKEKLRRRVIALESYFRVVQAIVCEVGRT